jgi:hypothetical protein
MAAVIVASPEGSGRNRVRHEPTQGIVLQSTRSRLREVRDLPQPPRGRAAVRGETACVPSNRRFIRRIPAKLGDAQL